MSDQDGCTNECLLVYGDDLDVSVEERITEDDTANTTCISVSMCVVVYGNVAYRNYRRTRRGGVSTISMREGAHILTR